MKKITKITFYSLGIITLVKTTKYVLNKKIENINYSKKEKVNNDEIENEKSKVNYIDITDVVLDGLNKQKRINK